MLNRNISMIGYHGTSSVCSCEIEKSGYKIIHGDSHWLGQGVYFFEHHELAVQWAKQKTESAQSKRFKSGNPVVYASTIEVNSDNYFDLVSPENTVLFAKYYDQGLEIIAERYRISTTTENKRKLDCIIYDLFALEKHIYVYRKCFTKHNYKYIGSKSDLRGSGKYPIFECFHEIQICVRELKCVKDIKRMA